MSHDKHGWNCACWHWVGGLFWLAALVALVCAWVSTSKGVPVWGLDQNQWYGNALILGVLAIPLKLKGHGMGCGTCGECK